MSPDSMPDRRQTAVSPLKMIFGKEFLVSVIFPVAIFSVCDRMRMTLLGTLLAGGWSIGVVLIEWTRTRRLNIYASISAGFSAIGLVGTVISQNPAFYLAAPIAVDLLLAVVFLGSLLFPRPLIQCFAEYQMQHVFPEELRQKPQFRRAWAILTAAWGILSITQALLRIILLASASQSVYYAISTAYGNISTPLLLLLSFWFPGWYWRCNA